MAMSMTSISMSRVGVVGFINCDVVTQDAEEIVRFVQKIRSSKTTWISSPPPTTAQNPKIQTHNNNAKQSKYSHINKCFKSI